MFAFTSCTHSIRHASPDFTTKASSGVITLVVPTDIAQKIVVQRIGINLDKWKFEIGNAFVSIVPPALGTHFSDVRLVNNAINKKASSNTILIKSLDVKLEPGVTVFSEHKVILQTRVQYYGINGSLVFDRKFRTIGSHSGSDELKTWSGLVVFPMAIKGMNDSIEFAVTDSLLQLTDELIKAI